MGYWQALDVIRTGRAGRGDIVPVKPMLSTRVKFFGRYKTSGAIRDGGRRPVKKGPSPFFDQVTMRQPWHADYH